MNVLPPVSPSISESSKKESYRYTVTQEEGQTTLNMEVPKGDADSGRLGIETLKKYAINLLPVLGIKPTDTNRPKIDITGPGAKALGTRSSLKFDKGLQTVTIGFFSIALFGTLLAAGLLAGLLNPAAWVCLVLGALGVIGGAVIAGYGV